ncbi:MAG: DUF1326 domain-containing protein [Thiohalocapsa sp.]|jgi:hypothetical protein|nr:DUF1326 domain-containing protein [Thiohalocapsa sp.]MCF7990790.1 DUF1326 domain-containing protein [Thiohalocapsa sp.]
MANESDWKLKGNYFESCNCDLVCPCIFLRPPTEGFCEAFVGWHVEEGHMGDVKLDGLNIAAWLHSPGSLTDGNWRLALYLDDRASDEQSAALTRIFGGEAGGHPAVLAGLVGELLGVKSAPIEFKEENGDHFLEIPGVGRNLTHALEGEDGGKVTVANHPLQVSPGHPVEVGYSEDAHYKDYDVEWRQDNRVGLAAPFVYAP